MATATATPTVDNVVTRALRRKQDISESRRSLRWAAVNATASAIVYWSMHQDFANHFILDSPVLTWYTQFSFVVIFSLNCLVHLLIFFKLSYLYSSVVLTAQQQRLLAVDPSAPGFSPPPSLEPATPTADERVEPPFMTTSSLQDARWSSPGSSPANLSSSLSPSLSPHGSPNTSFSLLSTSLIPSFYDSYYADQVRFRRTDYSPSSVDAFAPPINDETSLNKYLKEFEQRSRTNNLARSESPPLLTSSHSTSTSSFWSFGHTLIDYSNILRRYSYQLASRSPQAVASHPDGVPKSSCGDDAWSRLGVSSCDLYTWTKNLRQWLSLTILDRLVIEIDAINDTLRRTGSTDLQIGDMSLNTLRQVCLTKGQLMPSLSVLLPYLEVNVNQEYLVGRFKELARGGCMSDFVWNGGGNFKGKPWAEHLPTDSTIIMHLFCTYLDSRLPPHPNYPDGKTFTSQCFVRSPDKPNFSKDSLLIYQTRLSPPHFMLVIGEEVWDLAQGRNNLFHTLLLFLLHIKIKENGMLGRVNLGLSGVNILCILDRN